MKPSEFDTHEYVFVCCAERDGGLESCGMRGRELHLALQAHLERRPGGEEFHVVASACLGLCSQRIPVALAAGTGGNRAWVGVETEDVHELADALLPNEAPAAEPGG